MKPFKPFKPPGDTITTSTPDSFACIKILGSDANLNGVHFSTDESRYLYALYGYDITRKPKSYPEIPPHPGPEPTLQDFRWNYTEHSAAHLEWIAAWKAWNAAQPENVDGVHHFEMTGAKLHCTRFAQRDGLRIMGMIAKFVEPGEDPVKFIAELLQDAGCDLTTGWEDEGYEEEDEEDHAD